MVNNWIHIKTMFNFQETFITDKLLYKPRIITLQIRVYELGKTKVITVVKRLRAK